MKQNLFYILQEYCESQSMCNGCIFEKNLTNNCCLADHILFWSTEETEKYSKFLIDWANSKNVIKKISFDSKNVHNKITMSRTRFELKFIKDISQENIDRISTFCDKVYAELLLHPTALDYTIRSSVNLVNDIYVMRLVNNGKNIIFNKIFKETRYKGE